MSEHAIKRNSANSKKGGGETANVSQGNISFAPSMVSAGAYSRQSIMNNSNRKSGMDESAVGLKRRIHLFSGIALIVGTMIGSGIFISPQGVTKASGSVGLSLINWFATGVVSLLAALCYAELGTLLPSSGAEFVYILVGYRSLNIHVGNILAFLFAWMNVLVLRPAMVAIIILTFATYCTEPFFYECSGSVAATKCLAVFALLVLCVINCFSVKIATGLQNVLTCAKLLALVIIILGGFVMMGQGNTHYLYEGFRDSETNPSKIALGLYNGMWAYDGWNNLNFVAEEVKNNDRNLPLSIGIGVPIVILLYLLTNLSYFSVLSVRDMIQSHAVALTWGNRVLGVMAWIIPLFVACSTLGAANGTLFSSGRLTYQAAKEGHMVEILSMVHIKKLTPLPSLVFTAFVAIIMVIIGNIQSLIEFFNFAVWIFYGLTTVSLIILRFKMKEEYRPFRVPIIIPAFVFLCALFLVVAPIIDNPQLEFLYVAIFIFSGLILYFPFVHFRKNLPIMEPITAFFQLLMNVLPPNDDELRETTI